VPEVVPSDGAPELVFATYSPDGATNMRPNRASIVYANLVRQAMPGVPVVLGGIEASLRRIAPGGRLLRRAGGARHLVLP
jgi:hypothetical protein